MRKKLITALLTGVLAITAIGSVSAAQLSDVTPENGTQVTANIEDPGMVSYTITIPDSVSFDTLTQPDTDADSNVCRTFEVEATNLSIKSNQGVTVWVKDSVATDGMFYLTQQGSDTPKSLSYDIYASEVNDGNIASSTKLNDGSVGSYGYNFCVFASGETGSKKTGTLVLNQRQLYGQELSEIAGDYSGTIAFHSALIER